MRSNAHKSIGSSVGSHWVGIIGWLVVWISDPRIQKVPENRRLEPQGSGFVHYVLPFTMGSRLKAFE